VYDAAYEDAAPAPAGVEPAVVEAPMIGAVVESAAVEAPLVGATGVGATTAFPPFVGPRGAGGTMVLLGGVRSLPLFGGPGKFLLVHWLLRSVHLALQISQPEPPVGGALFQHASFCFQQLSAD